MSEKIYPICVIGGGAAGVMSVLRTVLNNDETLFLPGAAKENKKSRAMWVAKVENMPGYHHYKKGIMQPNRDTLKWLSECDFKDKFHWKKNTSAASVVNKDDFFLITDSKGEEHKAKFVILCTGLMDVQPIIGDSIEPVFPFANAQVIDYCLRCDGHHVLGKHTSIIGHTNGAAWVSVMLYERYKTPSMTILTNGEKSQIDGDVKALLEKYDIKIIDKKIKEVLGDAKVPRLDGYVFEDGEKFESQFSFVSLGMIVYNEIAKSIAAQLDDRGFVVTNEKGMSSIENFYVAGDLRAGIKKQIYTAWDSAVDSADDINQKIRAQNRQN